jgi:hypothetical protein
MDITYPFTEEDSRAAYEAHGFNCGPNALAFALQFPLLEVLGRIPGFEEKRFTSPTMMKAGLANLGRNWTEHPFPRMVAGMFADKPSLVRIQLDGPWCAEGANPRWAYRETHWIVAWKPRQIFDVNGGIMTFESWCDEIVPALLANNKRANGKWFPTHIWRVEP